MKKKVAIIVSVAVLAVAAIGGTLAYFNATTDTLENVFIADGGFDNDEITLLENFESIIDGEVETDLTEGKTVEGVYPNAEITKQPFMTNNSETLSAFVGVVLTFDIDGQDATVAAFEEKASINGWGSDWKIVATNENSIVLVCETELVSGATTSNVFDNVKVNAQLDDTTMPNSFNVNVQGYAVQATGNDNTDAQAALNAQWADIFPAATVIE